MATPLVLSVAGLDAFKDKAIGDICPLGYADGNHCAHFVGHTLKLNPSVKIGATCDALLPHPTKFPNAGSCVRAHELFNFCTDLNVAKESGCLIFITKGTNIAADGTMGNIPQKHVGIYFQGEVWNYSNDAGKVLREKVADFKARIDTAYHGHTVAKFTEIPSAAVFLSPSQILALAKP